MGHVLERLRAVVLEAARAGPRVLVVVDGVFLLRPELAPLWTVSFHLRVSPAESLRRALTRDVKLMGSGMFHTRVDDRRGSARVQGRVRARG